MEKALIRIRGVEPLGGFRVRLVLTDGREKEVDLESYLEGPIFEPIRRDPAFFRKVAVDREIGTISWPNGADICPDVLVHGRTPARFRAAVIPRDLASRIGGPGTCSIARDVLGNCGRNISGQKRRRRA